MKVLISGHRTFKLAGYDIEWIKESIEIAVATFPNISLGLSGMAGGIDLWFCESCFRHKVPYIACPPFEDQLSTIPPAEHQLREWCMAAAVETWPIRNSQMVVKCDAGILCFDGNKGGTANVFQQMIEAKKPFIWINPAGQKIWECF